MMGGSGKEASLLALLVVIFLFLFYAGKQEGIPLSVFHQKGISLLSCIVFVMFAAFFKWVRIVDFLWLWYSLLWTADAGRSQRSIQIVVEQLPENTHLLNVDWDLFPQLLNVRSYIRYARGMNPGFNYLIDAPTEELFRTVDSHDNPERWLNEAISVFDGSTAITFWVNRHPQLLRFFQSTNCLKPVYPQDVLATFILQ